MASRKKNSKYLKKRRSQKRRSMKRKMKGGCGCSGGNSMIPPLMNGGGDYFLPGYVESPSFTGVPIHSFYANNTYQQGTDIQGSQLSSRLQPNMYVGGKKSKKVRFSKTINKRDKKWKKTMKGGMSFPFSFISSFSDPILGNNTDSVSTQVGLSGAMLGSNIVAGYPQDNYNPKFIPIPQQSPSLV